jgi:hypothetical protein
MAATGKEPITGLEPLAQAFVDRHGLWVTSTDLFELSQAISLKRIADALDSSETGGRVQGSVLFWLEQIAGAAVRS